MDAHPLAWWLARIVEPTELGAARFERGMRDEGIRLPRGTVRRVLDGEAVPDPAMVAAVAGYIGVAPANIGEWDGVREGLVP